MAETKLFDSLDHFCDVNFQADDVYNMVLISLQNLRPLVGFNHEEDGYFTWIKSQALELLEMCYFSQELMNTQG